MGWATPEEVDARLKVMEDSHAKGWPGRMIRGTSQLAAVRQLNPPGTGDCYG